MSHLDHILLTTLLTRNHIDNIGGLAGGLNVHLKFLSRYIAGKLIHWQQYQIGLTSGSPTQIVACVLHQWYEGRLVLVPFLIAGTPPWVYLALVFLYLDAARQTCIFEMVFKLADPV